MPANKFVVSIPDFPMTDTTSPDGNTAADPSGETGADPDSVVSATKELLTKGADNSVPALPTPPPTEDGNIFVGWVNKATGEAVKKGDKLTGNIEIEPVWKDCGEGNHADADGDNHCDECGYIMVKDKTPPIDDTPTDIGVEEVPQTKSGVPTWATIIIACFGVVIVACGGVLAVLLKKKK